MLLSGITTGKTREKRRKKMVLLLSSCSLYVRSPLFQNLTTNLLVNNKLQPFKDKLPQIDDDIVTSLH